MSWTSSGVILNLLVVRGVGGGGGEVDHVHLCCLYSDILSCVGLAYAALQYLGLEPARTFDVLNNW